MLGELSAQQRRVLMLMRLTYESGAPVWLSIEPHPMAARRKAIGGISQVMLVIITRDSLNFCTTHLPHREYSILLIDAAHTHERTSHTKNRRFAGANAVMGWDDSGLALHRCGWGLVSRLINVHLTRHR